jgi:hypothetical protein
LSVISGRSLVFSRYSGFITNKAHRHEIIELLLKVDWDYITLTRIHEHWFLFKPRKLISRNLNELTAIKSSTISLFPFLSEHYSTTDSSTQGNISDGNNGGQVLLKNLNRTKLWFLKNNVIYFCSPNISLKYDANIFIVFL